MSADMGLGTKPFVKGMTELADGAYAWLAPDGSWGWSNAGLIVSGDESMIVVYMLDDVHQSVSCSSLMATAVGMSLSATASTTAPLAT